MYGWVQKNFFLIFSRSLIFLPANWLLIILSMSLSTCLDHHLSYRILQLWSCLHCLVVAVFSGIMQLSNREQKLTMMGSLALHWQSGISFMLWQPVDVLKQSVPVECFLWYVDRLPLSWWLNWTSVNLMWVMLLSQWLPRHVLHYIPLT